MVLRSTASKGREGVCAGARIDGAHVHQSANARFIVLCKSTGQRRKTIHHSTVCFGDEGSVAIALYPESLEYGA